MKARIYEVVGIKKLVSKEKQKTFTFLCCMSVNEERSDSLCGHDVCQLFGKGTEMIGDTVKAITMNGKSVIIEDED